MGGIRRVPRASAWILTGILGAIVCFYLVLIAINWRDRAPSEAVLLARALIENRPEVPASDNAYIYILGFSAPDEADPQQAGEARLAWLKARGYAESSKTPDPVPGRNMRADRPEHIQEAFRCASGRQSCIAEIEKNMPILAEWLDPNDVVLTRYRQLLDRTAWCELVPDDAMIPFPTYSGVFDGQRLHMVALWKQSGDAAAIRDGLQKDIVFWRTVLRSSDLLITKLIAVGALRQHFAYGNVVLRGVPTAKVLDAIPASWKEEISVEERSMMRALAGEVNFAGQVLDPEFGEHLLGDRTVLERAAGAIVKPFFKRQDYRNQVAEHYMKVARFTEGPFSDYPTRFAGDESTVAAKGLFDWLYNPIGDWLATVVMPESSVYSYAARVADIEGARRAALLAAQLRANGVTPENIREQLQQSPLRNPYTDEPFEWDDESGTIVFSGLAEGERKRQDYLL
jgi:hypothetical protein